MLKLITQNAHNLCSKLIFHPDKVLCDCNFQDIQQRKNQLEGSLQSILLFDTS